jgi:hypothetical protein
MTLICYAINEKLIIRLIQLIINKNRDDGCRRNRGVSWSPDNQTEK